MNQYFYLLGFCDLVSVSSIPELKPCDNNKTGDYNPKRNSLNNPRNSDKLFDSVFFSVIYLVWYFYFDADDPHVVLANGLGGLEPGSSSCTSPGSSNSINSMDEEKENVPQSSRQVSVKIFLFICCKKCNELVWQLNINMSKSNEQLECFVFNFTIYFLQYFISYLCPICDLSSPTNLSDTWFLHSWQQYVEQLFIYPSI